MAPSTAIPTRFSTRSKKVPAKYADSSSLYSSDIKPSSKKMHKPSTTSVRRSQRVIASKVPRKTITKKTVTPKTEVVPEVDPLDFILYDVASATKLLPKPEFQKVAIEFLLRSSEDSTVFEKHRTIKIMDKYCTFKPHLSELCRWLAKWVRYLRHREATPFFGHSILSC